LNGVHDIGGMDGFGPVLPEANEPVFHEPWERRVFGMRLVGGGLPPTPLDAMRHRGERLDPLKYLSSSYYERWLAGLESALIETATLSRDEIEARIQQFAAEPDRPMPRREDPAFAEQVAAVFRAGRPAERKVRSKPRFAAGDRIVTRNLNPQGHTRLPRYARSKHGVVVAHHGAHVFPDTNAHGLGENPQHLYTVRIAARELWGSHAESNESVCIDLWESYLDQDKTGVKSTGNQRGRAAKKITAQMPLSRAKATAHPAVSKRTRETPRPAIPAASPAQGRGKSIAQMKRAKAGGRSGTARPTPSGRTTRKSR